MRNTKQKQVIMNYFREFPNAHPCAEEVYEYVKKEIPTIGIATIYRNLNQMIENNDIRCLLVQKNGSKYDYFAKEHAHFVCENCGEIINIPYHKFESAQKQMEKEMGCTISKKDIVFRGVCQKCQEEC